MDTPKRTTVHFEPELLDGLRLRAAANECSISNLVNEAVRAFLVEDLADLAAFDQRRDEPSEAFDSFLRSIRFGRESAAVTARLDAVHGAPGADQGLDPVLAELQSATLEKHSDR